MGFKLTTAGTYKQTWSIIRQKLQDLDWALLSLSDSPCIQGW